MTQISPIRLHEDPEIYPFADKRSLTAADRLGIGKDAKSLARLVEGLAGFTRLLAGALRVDFADAYASICEK